MALPAKASPAGDIMEAVIIKGDLKKLTPEERVQYYNETCKSVGLNPLTRPFEYIDLQGKLTLYARRDAADQLRKIHGINIQIVSQDVSDGVLSIHVRATDKTGRTDEDLGVVAFPEQMRGDVRANTIMKAVTKGKRRVTLSISGLGWLDETEVEDIPAAAKKLTAAPNVMTVKEAVETLFVNPDTGEITETTAPDPAASPGAVDAAPHDPSPSTSGVGGAALSLEDMARSAAMRGQEAMRIFWRNRTKDEQAQINKIRPELNKLVDAAEAQIAEEMGDDRSSPGLR
jgi:hypothetical protein